MSHEEDFDDNNYESIDEPLSKPINNLIIIIDVVIVNLL